MCELIFLTFRRRRIERVRAELLAPLTSPQLTDMEFSARAAQSTPETRTLLIAIAAERRARERSPAIADVLTGEARFQHINCRCTLVPSSIKDQK